MPTSSQSRILSVVDYQLHRKQQNSDVHDGQAKPKDRTPGHQSSAILSKRRPYRDDRRSSIDSKNNERNRVPSPPPPSSIVDQRRHSDKSNDGFPSARASQRQDLLHMPIININDMTRSEHRTPNATVIGTPDHPPAVRQTRTAPTYERTKSTFVDSSRESFANNRNSFSSDHEEPVEHGHRLKQMKKYPTPISVEENNTSVSDVENMHVNNTDDDPIEGEGDDPSEIRERRPSLLTENARRLMTLGTIRPSKTFYKHLPAADVNHLMNYFRRMKTTNQRLTSEEINQELADKHVEYKPKIFFDSACVTKTQVAHVEKIIEPYADQIRTHQAELARLDNPMRFVIKPMNSDPPLVTIPREYNDCMITLVTQTDPLRKSALVSALVKDHFLDDVKANSLDISYFPGGVNYDVPRDEIDENGQMNIETYQKLKKRLTNRKVWHFDAPPEKKPNALLAVLPAESSARIDHQRLLDALYDRLKSDSNEENSPIDQRILSIEFIPLSCIVNSMDIPNQFIIDCDSIETKQLLMEKPLKITVHKHSALLELQSHDESMQREYEKFVKSEKYRELIKNHDEGKKRASATKK